MSPEGLHANRTRAESFGDLAELYDRARPRYPEALLDHLLTPQTTHVLDVGCGTGIAAAQLADRGVNVLGIEIDERMAAVARAKGLEVDVAPFESWDPRGRRFDLITSAQAWHWIDPQKGPEKMASLLRAGGRAAVFWNFGDPPPPVRERLTEVYRRLAPELAAKALAVEDVVHRERNRQAVANFTDSGLFGEVRVERFEWQAEYDTAGWVAFLATHSDHHTLPAERRERLLDAVAETLDAVGGRFDVQYRTVLIEALRT